MVDADTGQIRDVAGLAQLASEFPDSGTVRLRLLNAQLEGGDGNGVLATLEWLNQRGYVFSEVARGQIPKLVGEGLAERATALLLPPAAPVERSAVVLSVPEFAGLTESVVREPRDDRTVISSVSERAIFAKRPGGGWDAYRPEGVANISGMALDPRDSTIWLGVGNIDGGEGRNDAFSGLLALPYSASQEIRIAAPAGVSLSDITVAEDGAVYASDPVGGGVYARFAGEDTLSTLIAPGTFRSPQGLAASADGRRLYVSDYRYGIAIVDLETRAVSRLVSDIPAILDGVDGLWRYGNELVAMQNGTSPMRIVAFRLSEDGLRVIGQRVLERAHADWTEPLSGSLDGDNLLYIGNGQWDRYVAGQQAQDKPPLPTEIRILRLSEQ